MVPGLPVPPPNITGGSTVGGVGANAGEGAADWLGQTFESIQSAIAPLQAMLKSVQFLCTILAVAGVGITFWSIYKQQQISRSR